MSQHSPSKPSPALLSAALCGLFAVACDSSDSSKPAACPHAPDGGRPRITAVRSEPEMTLERFTAECDAENGKVELHAHCGGVNTCAGFSYDDETHALTEHTCCALNTCSGYSCVVPI
jgi:hypothetical protein